MRTDILEKKDNILKWINQHQSKAFICRELKCKPETLDNYLKKMGIEYKGNQSGKGLKHDPKKKTAEEYSQSSCVRLYKLKSKLIEEGLKQNCCELCGISTWLNEPIVLEIHHKNGNHYDNNLNNLMLLCPNCHSIQKVHKK